MNRQETTDKLTPIFHDLLTTVMEDNNVALIVITADKEGISTVGNLPPEQLKQLLENAIERVSEHEPDNIMEKPRPN